MTPSEHPGKLPQRLKTGSKNRGIAKKAIDAGLAWSEKARDLAGKLDAHAEAMAKLQADLDGYEASLVTIVNTIKKLEADHAKAKDEKKKAKIEKEHKKLDQLVTSMVSDMNKRFNKELDDIWKNMRSDGKLDQVKL